jgi:hypothetical protein
MSSFKVICVFFLDMTLKAQSTKAKIDKQKAKKVSQENSAE